MTSRAFGARGTRSPHSRYDVVLIMTSRALVPTALAAPVLIMTSFATELAKPNVTYGHLNRV